MFRQRRLGQREQKHEMVANNQFEERFARVGVVPLIQADSAGAAVAIGQALLAGGLPILEVVLRTDQALRCLEAVSESVPDAIVGAGTVLTAAQAEAAVGAGAAFIVSPGLDEAVVAVALTHGLPVLPGIATATELQRAWNLGLRTVKFFPASVAGGGAMIKALGSAFRQVKFMPTGGVTAANLAEYLAIPSVVACGGSWLTPAAAVAEGDFARITKLAAEAAEIARTALAPGPLRTV